MFSVRRRNAMFFMAMLNIFATKTFFSEQFGVAPNCMVFIYNCMVFIYNIVR